MLFIQKSESALLLIRKVLFAGGVSHVAALSLFPYFSVRGAIFVLAYPGTVPIMSLPGLRLG
jgi:hypothetical protein